MVLLAASTLLLLAPQPQAEPETKPDPRLKPALSKSELGTLNKKLKSWMDREGDLKAKAGTRGARSARKKRDKAKDDFFKAFNAKGKSKKRNLLQNVGDLLGIFENAFPYDRVSTSGELKKFSGKAPYPPDLGVNWNVLAPKKYNHKQPYRSVMVLIGKKGDKWDRPKNYLEAAWKGTTSYTDTFFIMPEPRAGYDYEKRPDISTPEGEAAEMESLSRILFPLGEAQRTYRLDRRKMILDCGVGNSAFGLRLASYFPDRFAGIILRDPSVPKGLRLESLRGLRVMLVSTDNTKAACEELQKSLEAMQPDTVTIVGAKDAAPYPSAAAEIDAWMRKVSRGLFPEEVFISPNHDRFKRAHWVSIDAMEPLESGSKPFVKVRADKEKNRIIITSKHVSEMGLLLNDALVDLDKEVVLVVNGKEIKGNVLPRSLRTLEQYLNRRFDATSLYTAYLQFELPRAEKK